MKIPCKTCIVFAMCKSRIWDKIKEFPTFLPSSLLISLRDECPAINDYIKSSEPALEDKHYAYKCKRMTELEKIMEVKAFKRGLEDVHNQ